MAELLTALNISEQKQRQMTGDVFVAEDLIIAMQKFYQSMPEGGKKDVVESTIIELVSEVVRQSNKI